MLSCKVGVKNINVLEYDEKQLRSWANKGILKCAVCEGVLVYKHGLIRIPHFAHEKDTKCTYTFYENETKAHCTGKILLYNLLQKLNNISDLELESYIKETRQRPDLYFKLNNRRYVIEYQCTPITLEEYLERKELYKLNDITDIWILGVDNFNFKPSGKIKMKVLDNVLYRQDKLYYLNPFEEIIYKIISKYTYVNDFYYLAKNNLCETNNFCIDDDKIIFNEIVSKDFKQQLDIYIKNILALEKKEKDDLINYQKEIFNSILSELKLQKETEIKNKINLLLLNKNIYIYNDFKTLNNKKNQAYFYYTTYKSNKANKMWLLEDLYNSYDKLVIQENIHIFFSKVKKFNFVTREFLKECFPDNEIIYVND